MSLKAIKRWLVVPVFSIASVHGAIAAEKTVLWNLERLANSQEETISLKVPYQERALEIETLQLRVIGRTFLKLKDASELNPRLLLMSGQRPNAFAGPVGGEPTVLINTAMLDLVGYNPDEWAALLGHELAHLKLEHSAKGANRDLMLDLLRAAVNSHFDYDIAGRYGSQLLSKLIDTKFSRDQERQSDYLGVIWALESDFSPYGAVSLHTRFLNYKGDKGIPFLSSHPSSEERIRTLTETAERLTVKNESDINSQRSN